MSDKNKGVLSNTSPVFTKYDSQGRPDDSNKNSEKGLVTYELLAPYLQEKETNSILIGPVIFWKCFYRV